MKLVVAPHCIRCRKPLMDFNGNLLIRSDRYANGVGPRDFETLSEVIMACKNCTAKMDTNNTWDNDYPIAWELSAVQEMPEYYLGRVLRYAVSKDPHYRTTDKFIDDFVDLFISMLETDEALRLMHAYYPADYEGEGPRYQAFCSKREINGYPM